MVNRILWSAAITLALTFSPSLAFSVPTKTVKKKASKPQEKVAKKSKSSKSSNIESYGRSTRGSFQDGMWWSRPLFPVTLGTMDDSTTSSERSRVGRVVYELLEGLLFLATFSWGFEDFFFTVLVGTEKARLGEKVNARVIAALHVFDSPFQNLLCYGTILYREPF